MSCVIAHTGRAEAREVAARVLPRALPRTASASGCSTAEAADLALDLTTSRWSSRPRAPPRTARSSSSSAATAPSCGPRRWPRVRHPAARREPRPRRLPRRGRVRRRRVHHRRDRAPPLHGRGADDPRRDRLPRRRGQAGRSTWALNEASVEKAARERMLEVVVEVDGRPLSRWGCDGVVCATPDRLDGLQLQRRRTHRLARGRGAADGADQRARALRPTAGGLARARCSPSR